MDPQAILSSALDQRDISSIEALILMQEGDHILPEIFFVANTLNRRIHQNTVTYELAKLLTYTNVCKSGSSYFPGARRKNHPDAFRLTPEEVVGSIKGNGTLRKVTLRGGLNPEINVDQLLRYAETVRDAFPKLHLQAFSPVEIHFASRRWRVPVDSIMMRLKDIGIDSIAGFGAEILNDKLRKKVCPDILRTQDWIEIIRIAGELDMNATATMTFGHIEDEIHICEHLEIIRSLQRETGVFTEFMPMLFNSKYRSIESGREMNDFGEDKNFLKIMAISRIYLGEDIPIIQAPWWSMGWERAARAFTVGANCVGLSRVCGETPVHDSVSRKREMSISDLKKAIQKGGRKPKERRPVMVPVETAEVVRA
jgi:CofH subfamily radical SAM domain protein